MAGVKQASDCHPCLLWAAVHIHTYIGTHAVCMTHAVLHNT